MKSRCSKEFRFKLVWDCFRNTSPRLGGSTMLPFDIINVNKYADFLANKASSAKLIAF